MPHRSLGRCTNYAAEAQLCLCFPLRTALGPAPAYLVAQSRSPPKKVDARGQMGQWQRPVYFGGEGPGSSLVTYLYDPENRSLRSLAPEETKNCSCPILLQTRLQDGALQKLVLRAARGAQCPSIHSDLWMDNEDTYIVIVQEVE